MKIYWSSLKLMALLLLLSACSNSITEPPRITLGLASVANKGAPELAQNLFAEPGESWDRVPIHWNEIQIENARIPLDGARCVRLYDQRGVQIDVQGQPDNDCLMTFGSLILPSLPPGKEGDAGEMMVGGPTFILIE